LPMTDEVPAAVRALEAALGQAGPVRFSACGREC
jgi:hypothetical protein